MTNVLAFATRLALGGIEINLCGKRANRLWFWPEWLYNALPDADKDYIRTHRTELKELVRTGQAPRLDDLAQQAAVAPCPYCRRRCVGPDHFAFATLHADDPTEVARRAAERTKEMLAQVGKGAY